MPLKWIGALLIVLGCGGFGFSLAAAHIREEKLLRQLIATLDYMTCELQFRMTPLPELFHQAGKERQGKISLFFDLLGQELDKQLSSDVSSCIPAAMAAIIDPPESLERNLCIFRSSLGKFDLEEKLSGLETQRIICRNELQKLEENRDGRLRSYQTLGLCAGAAIAILLV